LVIASKGSLQNGDGGTGRLVVVDDGEDIRIGSVSAAEYG